MNTITIDGINHHASADACVGLFDQGAQEVLVLDGQSEEGHAIKTAIHVTGATRLSMTVETEALSDEIRNVFRANGDALQAKYSGAVGP